MPDGAVIIAAITSCTNTSNPRNVIAAGLLARNANARGLSRKPWVKSSLAPGSKAVQLYLEDSKLLPELEQLGFEIGRAHVELQSLMRISYAVFCLKKKKTDTNTRIPHVEIPVTKSHTNRHILHNNKKLPHTSFLSYTIKN